VVVDGYTDASQDSYAVDVRKGFNGGFTAAVEGEQIGFMNTEGTSGKVVRINMSEPLNAAVLDTGLGVSFRGGFSAGDYGYLVPFEGALKYGVPETRFKHVRLFAFNNHGPDQIEVGQLTDYLSAKNRRVDPDYIPGAGRNLKLLHHTIY
jgi:hypothetical protein